METTGRGMDDRIYSDDGHWWWSDESQTWHPVTTESSAENKSGLINITDGVLQGDVTINKNDPNDIATAMLKVFEEMGIFQNNAETNVEENKLQLNEHMRDYKITVDTFQNDFFSSMSDIFHKIYYTEPLNILADDISYYEPELYQELASDAYEEGNLAKARSILEENINLDNTIFTMDNLMSNNIGDMLSDLSRLDKIAYKQNDFKGALSYLTKQFELSNSNSAGDFLHLGFYMERVGDYTNAQKQYERALINSSSVSDEDKNYCIIRLGCLAIRLGNFDLAKSLFNKSLEMAEKQIEMWVESYNHRAKISHLWWVNKEYALKLCSMLNLANLCHLSNDNQNAEYFYGKSIELFDEASIRIKNHDMLVNEIAKQKAIINSKLRKNDQVYIKNLAKSVPLPQHMEQIPLPGKIDNQPLTEDLSSDEGYIIFEDAGNGYFYGKRKDGSYLQILYVKTDSGQFIPYIE